ncbi:MAG: FAD-dependent oxidoreductase [Deltaproteobacteria bacterium]|nr:FAD-dependent oxidoreductase [Deltaproteobacteria bacterium]
MKKVIVLGGGFAGLACLVELSRARVDLELHLLDAEKAHCRITRLHQTFHTPLQELLTPFNEIGLKHKFSFHQEFLSFQLADLKRWDKEKRLMLGGKEHPFDYLVVATGSKPVSFIDRPGIFGLKDLRQGRGMAIIENFCSKVKNSQSWVTFVGGGATSIQALFEAKNALENNGYTGSIRILTSAAHLVPNLPEKFHRYIHRRLINERLEYVQHMTYLEKSDEKLLAEDVRTGMQVYLPSQITFVFSGVKPSPVQIETNSFGQVLNRNISLQNIFSAGDCSFFLSKGLNHMTAQAAIHKGRLVARNILADLRGRSLAPYSYREKGYFISLGKADAVGWFGAKAIMVKGVSALALKEAPETQFSLFLGGINTYGSPT